MDITQLALSCMGWVLVQATKKNCTDLLASLFSTEVNSSHRKPTPGSTKIARKPNLYLFASSFVGRSRIARGAGGLFMTFFSGDIIVAKFVKLSEKTLE